MPHTVQRAMALCQHPLSTASPPQNRQTSSGSCQEIFLEESSEIGLGEANFAVRADMGR